MVLDQRDMLEDYWLKLDKHFMTFYCNILKKIDCIMCSDFYISVTIKLNMTRQM